MAKTLSTLLGVVFLLAGICGFVAPGLLGLHLSLAHNVIHIVSGVVALYFGLAGTLRGARLFCLAFGAVYLLLGVVGFLTGGAKQHTIAGITHSGQDTSLLQLLPGSLELATMDHGLHVLLGVVFLIAGLITKTDS